MLSVKQAASQSGISAQRLYQLLGAGRVSGVTRIGRTWVLDAEFQILPGRLRGAPGHVEKRKKS